jgi:hypothetical protein
VKNKQSLDKIVRSQQQTIAGALLLAAVLLIFRGGWYGWSWLAPIPGVLVCLFFGLRSLLAAASEGKVLELGVTKE